MMVCRYKAIKVKGIKQDEHRFIMEKHLGRKLKRNEVVHHKDENPRNNSIDNLELLSLSEHGRLHRFGRTFRKTTLDKLRIQGQQHRPMARLSINDVRQIRVLLKEGKQQKEIAILYGVHSATITKIKLGETWSWVS